MSRYIDADKIEFPVFESKADETWVKVAINATPTADVRENVHGEWVKLTGMMPPELFGRHLCSECDGFALHDWKHHKEQLTDFCPNCGADMRKVKENE